MTCLTMCVGAAPSSAPIGVTRCAPHVASGSGAGSGAGRGAASAVGSSTDGAPDGGFGRTPGSVSNQDSGGCRWTVVHCSEVFPGRLPRRAPNSCSVNADRLVAGQTLARQELCGGSCVVVCGCACDFRCMVVLLFRSAQAGCHARKQKRWGIFQRALTMYSERPASRK